MANSRKLYSTSPDHRSNTSQDRICKKSTGKRKFHTKSRNGCSTCKRRRVKCDEHHPICSNCDRMGIECVYLILQEQPESPEILNSTEKQHHLQSRKRKAQIPTPATTIQSSPMSNLASLASSSFLSNNSIKDQIAAALSGNDIQLSQLITAAGLSPELLNVASSIKLDSDSTLPQILDNLRQSKSTNIPHSQHQQQQQQEQQQQGSQHLQSSNPQIPTPSSFKSEYGPLPQFKQEHLSQNQSQRQNHQGQQTKQNPQDEKSSSTGNGPSISPNLIDSPSLSSNSPGVSSPYGSQDLNMLDLRLMYHYTTQVWPTITAAGISDSKIWSEDIPMLAFKYPFLMHSVLAFSATHLSRTERGLDQCVTCHRADSLRLLREAVLEMNPENTDALVASALILIMDSLANASLPTSSSLKSLPPSAWIFHVKGAATILTAVWPLSEKSRFYKFISVDLGDLGEVGYDLISGELSASGNGLAVNPNDPVAIYAMIAASGNSKNIKYSTLQCFDEEIQDLFPLPFSSPYLPTLAYMAKLHKERNKSDFILRVFAFPALLDKKFLGLLINCDISAMRIMRCYYKLLRNFTEQMKDKIWFLEGVSKVLPVDVEQYSGGGGMHMMIDFLGGPSTFDDSNINDIAQKAVQAGLLDPNNLPSSSITDSLGLDDPSALNDDNLADNPAANFLGV